MNKNIFADKIVEWYRANHRSLPWRESKDPYRIWLSEIILQQTRVVQGLPYYLKFLERFPDIFSLASASEQSVLRLWQGLGYYTRARNLHRCARIIVNQFKGQFPSRLEELHKLPGVGAYTAAAIASIAFGEPAAAVDGNAYRVLSRVFGIQEDINSGAGKKYFAKKANELLSKKMPDIFNQALMDFGATCCLPRHPLCDDCIFKKECVAYARGWQDRLPIKLKKINIRKRHFYYFVIELNKKRLMKKRGPKDIWQGLYDFYLVETPRRQKPESVLRMDPLLGQMHGEIQQPGISKWYKHVLTHQVLQACFIPIKISGSKSNLKLIKSEKMKFYSGNQISKLPKPKLVSHYLKESDFS